MFTLQVFHLILSSSNPHPWNSNEAFSHFFNECRNAVSIFTHQYWLTLSCKKKMATAVSTDNYSEWTQLASNWMFHILDKHYNLDDFMYLQRYIFLILWQDNVLTLLLKQNQPAWDQKVLMVTGTKIQLIRDSSLVYMSK